MIESWIALFLLSVALWHGEPMWFIACGVFAVSGQIYQLGNRIKEYNTRLEILYSALTWKRED